MSMPFFQGMGVGGGLIVAIGAQNAHVLSQGVRRNYNLLIALICCLGDAILIGLGVSGVGTYVASNPTLGATAAWGGAAFLFWYGWGAFRSALRGETLLADEAEASSLRTVVTATLAVTFLNPHTYLDTVVLLGSISGQFHGEERYLFGLGALTASSLWFFSLSLGARLLAPLFRRPAAWRVLDSFVCITMWTIAVSLVRRELWG